MLTRDNNFLTIWHENYPLNLMYVRPLPCKIMAVNKRKNIWLTFCAHRVHNVGGKKMPPLLPNGNQHLSGVMGK